MSAVVVVGGGLGGCAAAARLAKLGHDVTLLERSERLGGAIGTVEADGYTWDAGPSSTLLPAALRDLFRKSGRPLEREVDLVPLDPPRRHRLTDGTWLELPSGGRAVQAEALTASVGEQAAETWLAWTAPLAEVWERLRGAWFEHPYDPDHLEKATLALLRSRDTLHRASGRAFSSESLRDLALWQARADGHDPRNVPAWWALVDYLEQQLGVWTVPGGFGRLAEVLTRRLAERGVAVHTEVPALDLVVEGSRARGVRTPSGVVAGDHIVLAHDPRALPAIAPLVRRTMPALPPVVLHIGLEGEVPELPPETVLHGDPLLMIRAGGPGTAPEGGTAWTILGRGRVAEDLLGILARVRLDVREQVVARVDRSPLEVVQGLGGSPYGVLWQGRRTMRDRLGTRTPIDNVLMAGSHAPPASGVPFVALSAALVAQEIGPA